MKVAESEKIVLARPKFEEDRHNNSAGIKIQAKVS